MSSFRKRIPGGCNSIVITSEMDGLDGRPCVSVAIPTAGITLRFTLEDAESVGEAIIRTVRKMEEATA